MQTTDDLLMFTGANDNSLKQLLEGKLNAEALDNTVVTTNTLTDPVIVGNLNYKETSSETDSSNLISEISNKANLNAPNFSTSLQLNSTNVLLQPGDFNGTLQAYIELKAPEQIPPDLSGLVTKPGDYNGDLESYILLKAPEPDLSGLVSKPGDYADNNLESYIQLKAPDPDLSGYADRDEVSGTINSELGNYTNTADLNAQLENYSTTAGINTILADYADRDEVSGTINSVLGNYTNTADVNAQLENYSTTSGIIEKPTDYADNNLVSYIQSKALSSGFRCIDQFMRIRSQNVPDEDDMVILLIFQMVIIQL